MIRKVISIFKNRIWDYDSPRKMALGVSLGLIIGLIPITGIKVLSVIILSLIFRLNILAIAAGCGLTILFPLLSLVAFFVGEKLTTYHFATYSPYYFQFNQLISGSLPTRIYLVGSLVTGIVLGLLIYLPALWFFNYRQINLQRTGEQGFIFFESAGRRNALAKRVALVLVGIMVALVGLIGLSITINPILPVLGLTPFRRVPTYEQLANTIGNRGISRELFKMDSLNSDALLQTDFPHKHRSKRRLYGGRGNTSQEVIGFYVNWDPNSFTSLQRNIGHLNYIAPEWLHLTGEGPDLTQEIDKKVVTLAGSRKVPIIPLFNNYDNGWQAGHIHKVLRDPVKRMTLINQLFDIIRTNGFQGINIDLENLKQQDAPYLTAFMKELYGKFHHAGLLVTQDVSVGDSGYNYKALVNYNDYIILMVYDEHYEGSDPGPIASKGWVANVMANVPIPPQKLIVGLGNYGVDWIGKGNGEEAAFENVMAIAERYHAPIQWDPGQASPHLEYTDEDGNSHVIWFQDAVTLYNQVLTSMNYGQAGFALWRLGAEDPSVWRVLGNLPTPPDPRSLSQLLPFDSVQRFGTGEILQVLETPKTGQRQIVPGTSKQIASEKYLSFPAYYVMEQMGHTNQKVVALTFDDGPDPDYTDKILEVLKKYKVNATFFMVGANAQKNPGIVARVFREGNLIGSHTFTHPNVALISDRQTRLELNATQRVIEEITGHKTILFRPPYVADAEPQTPEELIPIIRAQKLGYLTVGELNDSEDWSRPGVNKIVDRVLLQANNGNIILMHDSGGDRSQTVTALPLVIQALKAKGYRFVTVDRLLQVSRDTLMPPVNGFEDTLVSADRLGFTMLYWQEELLWWLFDLAIILGIARLIFLAAAAIIQFCRTRKRVLAVPVGNPLASVIIAAYNEEKVIGSTIGSLLKSTYFNLEIIVVNDGSQDNTGEVVRSFAQQDKRVRVIDKENGGKATAINLGIEHCTGDFIVTLDADTVFEPQTIELLLAHFGDPDVGAVSGNVKVGNLTNLLTIWQYNEYIIGFNLERRAFDLLNCISVVPGAVGAWRKKAVLKAGSYRSDTLAEDTDLTLTLREMGYKITYESRALAWTESPADFRSLIKQRFRWTFGTLQCLWKHRKALMNPKYGTLGLIALPNMWIFQIGFQALSPLVDIMMVVSVLTGHFLLFAIYYAAFLLVDLLVGWLSFTLEGDSKKSLIWLFIQRIVYRQFLYYVVIKSIWTAIKGIHVGWNKLQRQGNVEEVRAMRK